MNWKASGSLFASHCSLLRESDGLIRARDAVGKVKLNNKVGSCLSSTREGSCEGIEFRKRVRLLSPQCGRGAGGEGDKHTGRTSRKPRTAPLCAGGAPQKFIQVFNSTRLKQKLQCKADLPFRWERLSDRAEVVQVRDGCNLSRKARLFGLTSISPPPSLLAIACKLAAE